MRFFTFFPDDWLTGTSNLSAEERGVFINLVAYYMSKDGDLPDDDRLIARETRVSLRRWRTIKERLVGGSFISIKDGFIHQHKCDERLEKDGKFSLSQSKRAASRWRNKSTKSGSTGGSTQDKNEIKTPLNDANQLENNNSEDAGADAGAMPPLNPTLTYVRGAEAPAVNPEKVIFGECLKYLMDHGRKEISSRSLLGKWKKDYGPGVVIEIVGEAAQKNVEDPVAWIIKTLSGRHGNAAGHGRELGPL